VKRKKEEVFRCFAVRADMAGGTLLHNDGMPALFRNEEEARNLDYVREPFDAIVPVTVRISYPPRKKSTNRK
jgi:hypothetical protein